MPPMALEAIDRWVAEGRADAIAAAVLDRHGTLVERRFAGAAGERSLFALASLTKPVVALAALVAVEEGVLELDAPAYALLPALDDADRRSITLRHLLSHASGLPESVRGTPPLEVELKYPPGTRRAYSNEGYHLIGLLLEAATEMPFQRYITDAVIRPLGMDAFLPLPEAEQGRALEVRDPGLSSPGVPLFNAPQWRRRGNAAGGMFASLDAYARIVALLLGGGAPLLHRDTWSELASVQFPGIPGGLESFPKLHCPDWGAGVNIRGTGGPHWAGDAVSESTLSHFGASGTLMWADLERGMGLVCLANRGTYSGWMLAEGGWTELSGEVIAEHGAPG
jgi:CubicO group peptidase (beta-lactamase class C family)